MPITIPNLSLVVRAKGIWSVVAVGALYGCTTCQAESLKLMRRVLDYGDLEAKRGMVSQIYNFSRPQLMHAHTADGIDEARCWVDQQLELKTLSL